MHITAQFRADLVWHEYAGVSTEQYSDASSSIFQIDSVEVWIAPDLDRSSNVSIITNRKPSDLVLDIFSVSLV